MFEIVEPFRLFVLPFKLKTKEPTWWRWGLLLRSQCYASGT